MDGISLTQMLGATHRFAGRDWSYRFRELDEVTDEARIQRIAEQLLERFSRLTKNWTDDLNTEWVIRYYLASRLIMGSTLHVNAAVFAKERNLGVAVPYLRYYAALNTARALCLTLPDLAWESGELIKISHSRAIENATSFLARFDKDTSERVQKDLRRLKAERELLAYRMPSSGPKDLSPDTTAEWTCTLLGDAAQFVSELLVASLVKNAAGTQCRLDPAVCHEAASVELEGHLFVDSEDMHRLVYLSRKHPYPASLVHLMTDGHVEEFFGSWKTDDESRECQFDPDDAQRVIFDI